MVAIRSRSSWNARPPKSTVHTVAPSSRTGFVLHYSLGPETQTPRQIQNYHMDSPALAPGGASDIGYNLLTDVAGVAYMGRGWDAIGAHAGGANTPNYGVCFIGRDGMTDAAKRTVIELYDMACERSGRTLARLGHRDLNSTTCPGDNNFSWWKSASFRDVSGGAAGGENPLLGLREGDGIPTPSEGVKAVQRLIVAAGFGELLGNTGVDGQWGPATSRGLVAARQYVGSGVETNIRITGEAYAQLIRACARREAERAVARLDIPSGGGGGSLPTTENITITGTLRRP